MEQKYRLSMRLQALADMVTPDFRLCDVGCDHAFVPVELVRRGICPRALAMDVRSGPLSKAETHIAEAGLSGQIKTRLSDGLSEYKIGEADSLLLAGMGGKLMLRILQADLKKALSFREWILEPQSHVRDVRHFLRMSGLPITAEDMVEEDGHFYPIIKVDIAQNVVNDGGGQHTISAETEQHIESVADKQPDLSVAHEQRVIHDRDAQQAADLEDMYGPLLLANRHPVLLRYLEREQSICRHISERLDEEGQSGEATDARRQELNTQLQCCEQALLFYSKK